jgi:hypothetical protein
MSGLAHEKYDLLDGGIVLVRPDGYIAYRSADFDAGALRSYLSRLFFSSS